MLENMIYSFDYSSILNFVSKYYSHKSTKKRKNDLSNVYLLLVTLFVHIS